MISQPTVPITQDANPNNIMIQPEGEEQLQVADFLRRAQTKLNEASAGIFFATNNPRLLPSFDRGSDDDADAENCQEGTKHIITATICNASDSHRIINRTFTI
jgi:hypothetical protein